MSIQNVPVRSGTTSTYFIQGGRVAGTHWELSTVHTGVGISACHTTHHTTHAPLFPLPAHSNTAQHNTEHAREKMKEKMKEQRREEKMKEMKHKMTEKS